MKNLIITLSFGFAATISSTAFAQVKSAPMPTDATTPDTTDKAACQPICEFSDKDAGIGWELIKSPDGNLESGENLQLGNGQELLNVPMGKMIREMSNDETPNSKSITGEGVQPEIDILRSTTQTETKDIGDMPERAIPDGNLREHMDPAFARRIAAPKGCVTETGAPDANCDGVADAAEKRAKGGPIPPPAVLEDRIR